MEMSNSEKKVVIPNLRIPQPLAELSLDTRLLGQAVIELNIARKNSSIYPEGHVQLAHSIDRAYQVLKRLLETMPWVTLGVAKDCLFIGDNYLDRKNPVFKDFSLALYSRDIAAITFKRGLLRDDILQLCRVLTLDTDAIREAGGIDAVMGGNSSEQIQVQALDYTRLHFTEEEEIFSGKGGEKPELGTHIWRSFVTHLISNELDSGGQLEYLADKHKVNPSQIAELLNSGILDLKFAIESYENTIAKYLRETTGDQPMEKLISLLRDLNPTLRSQFLSVTFDHTAGKGEEGLLCAFPGDVVVEILQQANDEGKEISPTLIALLEKISYCETFQAEKSQSRSTGAPRASSVGSLSREQMKQLFHRETYEAYVDSEYNALLKGLISSGHVSTAPEVGIPRSNMECGDLRIAEDSASSCEDVSDKYLRSIEERELEVRLGRMILALMDKPMDLDDYRGFSERIIANVPELLMMGEIDLCHEILEMFRRHAVEKPESIQGVAGECLLSFNSSRVAVAAAAALEHCSTDSLERALSFVTQLGSQCIPKFIELYAWEEYPSKKTALLNALVGFGQGVLEEACDCLEGAPVYMVRNLLLLIQKIGGGQSLAHVRALLTHESAAVRMDALVTLLELKDPDVALYLRRALMAIEIKESLHAIFLAGFYQVFDVVEELSKMIRLLPVSRKTFKRNEELIRSLGNIGDVRAIPRLVRLAKTSLSLRPRLLRRMRLTLFESLSKYPRESIEELLRIGAQSGDIRILRICERLAREESEIARSRNRVEREELSDSMVFTP